MMTMFSQKRTLAEWKTMVAENINRIGKEIIYKPGNSPAKNTRIIRVKRFEIVYIIHYGERSPDSLIIYSWHPGGITTSCEIDATGIVTA